MRTKNLKLLLICGLISIVLCSSLVFAVILFCNPDGKMDTNNVDEIVTESVDSIAESYTSEEVISNATESEVQEEKFKDIDDPDSVDYDSLETGFDVSDRVVDDGSRVKALLPDYAEDIQKLAASYGIEVNLEKPTDASYREAWWEFESGGTTYRLLFIADESYSYMEGLEVQDLSSLSS